MSSRQLRKLQKQHELEQTKLRVDKDTPEEEEIPLTAKPSAFASFALLRHEDDPEEDEEDVEDIASEEYIVQGPAKPASPKKSRKKKKKVKAKDKAVEAAEPAVNDGKDEIDAALEALNIQPRQPFSTKRGPASQAWRRNAEYDRICALLGINSQHLKVATEMRNLFGISAINNHDDAGGAVPRAVRRMQRNQPMDLETALKNHDPTGKGLPEISIRRNPFIQGKSEWPKGTTGGLTMAVVDNMESTDGTIEFRFLHSDAYERVQQQFYVFVEMGDPSNLIGLLQQNPYNISLLLQVSKIAKDQGDHALSSDLIERALFTFGRAALSAFTAKLQVGKARLDFARPENRELWLAGYHYIKSLMMKGTYRTALEWAKLLFALSPEEDHYSMNLVIHHLAVRSYEAEWLMSIYDTSVFFMVSDYSSPSVALAALQLKDIAKSKEILSKDIRRLPWLFCMLFQDLNIDIPPSIWGSTPKSDEEELFSELYIHQTRDIWNTPNATSLLKEVAAAAPRLGTSGNQSGFSGPVVTLDVARFIYLEQTRELMTLLPRELLYRQPNSDSDPLPPSRENNIFSHPSQRLQFQVTHTPGAVNQVNIWQAVADVLPQWFRQNRDQQAENGDVEAIGPPDDGDAEAEGPQDDNDDNDDYNDRDGDDEHETDRLRAAERDHRLLELVAARMPGMFPDQEEEDREEMPAGGLFFRLMQRVTGHASFHGDGDGAPSPREGGEEEEQLTNPEMPQLIDEDFRDPASDDDEEEEEGEVLQLI